MRVAFLAALFVACAIAPGCIVVQTGVTNPIPAMRTVAVAPFVNLSAERSVDGRQFALAYQAELQKIPGYQVIPVGVTEQAIVDLELNFSGPGDAVKLAKALGADAVVIGAVTDYNPYYPPRIGLQVSWYAPEAMAFLPGIPIDPRLNEVSKAWRLVEHQDAAPQLADAGSLVTIRAQSPEHSIAGRNLGESEDCADLSLVSSSRSSTVSGPHLVAPVPPSPTPPMMAAAADVERVGGEVSASVDNPAATQDAGVEVATHPFSEVGLPPYCPPLPATYPEFCPSPELNASVGPHDPNQPIMSYTRIFDGSDAELTALLRDYVVLSGDLRSGGWEAYLHRTEDFMRFTSHRMIVEMLTLHGGEAKRRYVWFFGRHSRH